MTPTHSLQIVPPLFATVLCLVDPLGGRAPVCDDELDAEVEVRATLLAFVEMFPQAICSGGRYAPFSEVFRNFVVGLLEPGSPAEGMTLLELAAATGLSPTMLLNWLLDPKPEYGPDGRLIRRR